MNDSSSAPRVGKAAARHYWQRFGGSKGDDCVAPRVPDGADLAVLRKGVGRPPGSVADMWPFYAELGQSAGSATPKLRAEHHALVLFAFHQQSQPQLMNMPGVSLGAALRKLQETGAFSEDAVERRFTAAATTDDVDELAVLLRGLIKQLRQAEIGLDYELLFRDLVSWAYPESRDRARLRWGAGYFRFEQESTNQS